MSVILILALGIGLFFYSARQGVLLGQIAAVILSLATLHGVIRGGFRKIVMLAASIGVLTVAVSYPNLADNVISSVAGSSSSLANGIATVVGIGLTLLVASVLSGRLRGRHIVRRPALLAIDRAVGGCIGLAEGTLVTLAMCWMAVMIRPHAELVRDHPSTVPGSVRQQLATTLVDLSGEAQTDPLGGIVESTNLLKKSPTLCRAIDRLNATGRLDLESLDPETRAKLKELLPQLTGGGIDQLKP
jgi:uncharacterized membrane protein required for colicin V production